MRYLRLLRPAMLIPSMIAALVLSALQWRAERTTADPSSEHRIHDFRDSGASSGAATTSVAEEAFRLSRENPQSEFRTMREYLDTQAEPGKVFSRGLVEQGAPKVEPEKSSVAP